MKRALLFIAVFCMVGVTASNAQLAAGSTLPANITGTDIITDDAIDVQAWLDEGKTVVIDVFATWCGPCWGFHESGWLEDMNDRFGPEGTDQIRVLGIEADGNTAISELYNSTLGDWTLIPGTEENIHYSLMDEPSAANTLGIAYYPSLYIIQPTGVLVEIGTLDPNPRYNEEFWLNAMGITNGLSANISTDLALSPFCTEASFTDREVSFFNPTQGTIESANFDLVINGEVISNLPYAGDPVGPFQTGVVTIPGQTITEASTIEVNLTSLNDTEGDYPSIAVSADKYTVQTVKMTVDFTTDFYPSETSWSITDDLGNEVFSVASYQPGTADGFGGGGADANRTFSYEIEVDANATCLTFDVNDSYGDGLIAWTPGTNNPPGIEITDDNGVVVKDNFVTIENGAITELVTEGAVGFDAIEVLISADFSTSVEDINELAEINAYPNPALNELNLELNFNQSVDYTVSILDTYGKTIKVVGTYNDNLNKNINVADLAAGMYFISVQTPQGQNVLRFTKM